MKREQLRAAIRGAIATVPTPFDDSFRVDYDKMATLTRWWTENGLVSGKAVIKVAAAMGEGPQLADDEWPTLLRTVVENVEGKAPVVCGIHYKDTVRTIDDAKRAQDLGAIGLQISPPIFNAPTQDDIVRYYGDVSDAIDIGILVYVTRGMGCQVYPETYRRLVDFEHVVAIKWSPGEGVPYEDIYELVDTWNIIDNTSQPVRGHKLGGSGFINMTVECHPPHDIRVWELMEDGRHDEAQALWDSVNNPLREFYGKIAQKSGGQARVKKGVMALLGRPVGASRPPSQPLDDQEIEELRQLLIGFGWPVVA